MNAPATASFATEGGHWYASDGSAAYTIKARDGSDRPTTLRDARKLMLWPSVTTIIAAGARPALERWKAEQLMLAALTLPRLPDEREVGNGGRRLRANVFGDLNIAVGTASGVAVPQPAVQFTEGTHTGTLMVV